MKRNLLFSLLFFVAVFVGCNRSEDIIPENSRVVLEAYQNGTRVSFDGEKSAWEAGDCLSVMVDGLEGIYAFNYDAATDSKFVCDNLVMPAEQCDVYAFYGVEAEDINVADKTATVTLGAAEQTQSAQAPAAHIAGCDVLYGKAVSDYHRNIQIAMNHTIAVVKINLVNTLPDTPTIKSVTITAPEGVALAGEFIVNPSTDEITLADNAEVVNSVNLNFEEPISLGADGCVAWIAVAPFALAEDDNLVIDVVTTDDKVFSCTKQIPAEGVSFGAGRIMSTDITLGGNATLVGPELPATVEIVIDPTNADTMANFPTGANKTNSGTFTLAGYDFVFDSPLKFYLSGNGRIRFDSGITSTKNAMIKLPVIPNYKLSQVVMASIAKNSTNHNYLFAITDAQKGVITGGAAYKLDGSKYTYNLTLPANNTECYICISNTASAGNTNPANISYISLLYTKVE